MTRVALKGLAVRKLRSLVSALAVVLGVALVSGTFILTDSIEKAFSSILTSAYDETDAVVTSARPMGGMGPVDGAVSASLLERIRQLPEVEEAAGTLIDFSGGADPTTLLDKQGAPIDGAGPTFGFGIEPEAERFNPLELVEGRWAARDGEVVVDAETARRHGFSIGDRIAVVARGPARHFTIVGTAQLGHLGSVGGATIAVFDVETAQRLHGREGSFYTIAVAAKEGVARAQLVSAIRALAPASVAVRTGDEQAAIAREEASFVGIVRYFLLAFGGIALFVGAFVIVNTLSITVAQRTRELATLRMLGASRRQVRRSILVEGLALGVLASVVGLVAGFLLAEGLRSAFAFVDLEMPDADTIFRPRTAVVSLVAGIGVTSLASLVPAIRATHVAPLAAVRNSQTEAASRSPRTAAVALVLTVAGGLVVAWSIVSPGRSLLLVGAGALAAFVGTGMVAPRLARPLARLVGGPLAVVGGSAARIGRENAVRNPTRTASTAAALMVGVALMAFTAVVGETVVSSGETAIREQVRADYMVGWPNGWQDADAVRDSLATASGVTAFASIRTVDGGASAEGGGMVHVTGVDTASIADLYRFRWRRGTNAVVGDLGNTGAVLEDTFAEERRLSVGDALILNTRDGDAVEVVVRGIFATRPFESLVGDVVVSQQLFTGMFPPQAPALTLVRAADDAGLRAALRAFPSAELLTPAELAEARHGELLSVLRLLYVLLALAVLVSLLGMVNTLVLAVHERTREIGTLRAVGMTRRQVRRLIRHEGLVTALLGTALGIPLGIVTALAVIRSVDEVAFSPSLPLGTLALLVAVAVAVGLAAAALPARTASRLNILEALKYE